MSKRLIIGISGASGAVYGVRALDMLAELGVETHLVLTKAAELTLAQSGRTDSRIRGLAQLHRIEESRLLRAQDRRCGGLDRIRLF
ncbi:MAG: hypothetical protein RL230_1551 [Pseudomonadota bacterium]